MTLRSVISAFAVSFLVLSAAGLSATANPYFTDLSALAGTNSTGGYYPAYPTGINDSGAVLLQGESAAYSTWNYNTYLYSGGSLTNITTQELAGASKTICRNTAMNASGQIAIGVGAASSVNVLYSGGTNGTAMPLPVPSGSSSLYTYGIDNAGEVCGAASYVGAAQWGATVYSGGTTYTLDLPPTGQGANAQGDVYTAQAEAMSPNGAYAVGQWGYYELPNVPGQYACLWTPKSGSWTNGGRFSDISAAIGSAEGGGGYYPSLALAVNNSGQVLCTVGTPGVPESSGYIGSGVSAAIYNATTGAATLLGGGFMVGQAPNVQYDDLTLDAGMTQMINDHDQVVGYEVVGGVDHAVVWQNGTVTDLNTMYSSILPAGFVLNDAMAIDDNGDIAGFGTDAAGNTTQAFLLRAPLPGNASMDGRVDINDLTIVLSHFGQTGMSWADGNFTGSGTVDINDLTIVLAHYGQSVEAPAAGALSAVPEPGALALLAAAGLLGLLSYTRRKP